MPELCQTCRMCKVCKFKSDVMSIQKYAESVIILKDEDSPVSLGVFCDVYEDDVDDQFNDFIKKLNN